jgi:hypothetical protein
MVRGAGRPTVVDESYDTLGGKRIAKFVSVDGEIR